MVVEPYVTENETHIAYEGPFERVLSGVIKFMLLLMGLGLVVLIGSVSFVIAVIALSIR